MSGAVPYERIVNTPPAASGSSGVIVVTRSNMPAGSAVGTLVWVIADGLTSTTTTTGTLYIRASNVWRGLVMSGTIPAQ